MDRSWFLSIFGNYSDWITDLFMFVFTVIASVFGYV